MPLRLAQLIRRMLGPTGSYDRQETGGIFLLKRVWRRELLVEAYRRIATFIGLSRELGDDEGCLARHFSRL